MAHLNAKGLSDAQSLNSITAHAAHQSFANGAHPIDGVVMMDDGQLTVVYQSPHKPYQDTYVFDMAQAATIDPKVSQQTANLALDNHVQEFAGLGSLNQTQANPTQAAWMLHTPPSKTLH